MLTVLCVILALPSGQPSGTAQPPVRIYVERRDRGALDVWLFTRNSQATKAILNLNGYSVGSSRSEPFVQALGEAQGAMAFPLLGVYVMRAQVTLPAKEAYNLKLAVKLFSRQGYLLGQHSVPLKTEPSALRGAPETCLVVSRSRQRLYAQKEGEIVGIYKISTGRRHSDGGGPTPLMKTRIYRKSPNAYSNKYRVWMRYFNAITPDGLYGIHATSPRLYRNLGRADSHGCVRLRAEDARQIFASFPVGTYVEVRE